MAAQREAFIAAERARREAEGGGYSNAYRDEPGHGSPGVSSYAQDYHMGAQSRPTLTETVRNWRAAYDADTPRILPLPHPSWRNNAWLKKNPWFDAELLPVLRREVTRLVAKM